MGLKDKQKVACTTAKGNGIASQNQQYKMINNWRSTTQSVVGDVHPAGQTLQTW